MNKSELTKKVDVFYARYFSDAQFAEQARANPAQALSVCGIDINNKTVSVDIKVDDEIVNHFIVPFANNGESLSEEEMSSINAAKTKLAVASFGTVLGTASSADIANVTGKNRKA